MDDPTGEVTELLQVLISNACVNDGTPQSGQEGRNAYDLRSYLDGSGIDMAGPAWWHGSRAPIRTPPP